jgi:DNA polymerase-3 subunit epsilon
LYAVVDVETTGLRPSWHDRVVEIGIVQVDDRGVIERDWCTLVNPERDLGPQRIHGISAAEARRAPSFRDLVGAVTDLLGGRVLVAHNLSFDLGFLAAEYERAGVTMPVGFEDGLCTMELAQRYLPAAGRSLAGCCRSAGIEITRAHSALYDARAAAGLLGYYLTVAGQPPPWQQRCDRSVRCAWPSLPIAGVTPFGRRADWERPEHFLSRLVDRLPRADVSAADAYLEVLDRALLDGRISETEADALVDVATRLGLAKADVLALHTGYLHALAAVAVIDGVVSDDERRELDTVAALLGLHTAEVDQAFLVARRAVTLVGQPVGGSSLKPGDLVVFTGDMDEAREVWEARATMAGLRVGQSVTRQTRLVVAADPDTMSGKAKKAVEYGVPIVKSSAFLRMLP